MRGPIAVMLAALFLVAACGTDTQVAGQGSSGTDANGTSGGSGSGDQGAAGSGMLDFTGTTLEGKEFEGTSLEGKPAVLWFWAPWCPTCRAQSPHLSDLAKEFDGKLEVVGVGGLAAEDQIEQVAESIPNVTHLVDVEGAIWTHFNVTAQSTFEVVDADGEIVSSGYLDIGDLNQLVDDLAG